jgi:hypothetical protein
MTRLILCGCLVVGLLGCATTSSERSTGNSLSDADISAVETGVRSALKGVNEPSFRGLRSATSQDSGRTFVCGWVDHKKSNGALAGEEPFIGSLLAGQFTVDGLAHNQTDAAKIFSDCQSHGIAL